MGEGIKIIAMLWSFDPMGMYMPYVALLVSRYILVPRMRPT